MFKLICLLALGCSAYAATLRNVETPNTEEKREIVPVLRFETDKQPDGSFSFLYEGADRSYRQETGVIQNAGTDDEALEVTGSYRYIDANGQEVEVTYTAGRNGFVPIGTNILSEISTLAKAAAELPQMPVEDMRRKARSKIEHDLEENIPVIIVQDIPRFTAQRGRKAPVDTSKVEAARTRVGKPEVPKPEVAKPEVTTNEITTPEVVKPAAVSRTEVPKPALAKPVVPQTKVEPVEVEKPVDVVPKPESAPVTPKVDNEQAVPMTKTAESPATEEKKPETAPVVAMAVEEKPASAPAVAVAVEEKPVSAPVVAAAVEEKPDSAPAVAVAVEEKPDAAPAVAIKADVGAVDVPVTTEEKAKTIPEADKPETIPVAVVEEKPKEVPSTAGEKQPVVDPVPSVEVQPAAVPVPATAVVEQKGGTTVPASTA